MTSAKLDAKLARIIVAAPLTINFGPFDARGIFTAGDFRSVLMDPTLTSSGGNDRDERKAWEAALGFRTPRIYGALHVLANDPGMGPEGGAPGYGEMHARLHASVKRRTTVTIGDSARQARGDLLSPFDGVGIVRALKRKTPDYYTWLLRYAEGTFTADDFLDTDHAFGEYIEAQIKPPLAMKDVSAVYFGPQTNCVYPDDFIARNRVEEAAATHGFTIHFHGRNM